MGSGGDGRFEITELEAIFLVNDIMKLMLYEKLIKKLTKNITKTVLWRLFLDFVIFVVFTTKLNFL